MHILAPHMSCVVNMPLSPDQPNELEEAMGAGYSEIYVVTHEGIIKHHKLRGQNRFIRVKVDQIPNFTPPRLAQAINFLPAGKIPKALFDQVVAFFYGVIKKNGDRALEAMAHILWNQEQGYHIGIPTQKISGASVTYDWSYVPSGTSIIVDIHSHNYMNAFFSGTDDRDDRANISFSGVVGKMNEQTPQTVWRFNYQDRKFEAKFEDIFEAMPAAAIPDEWLEKVDATTQVMTRTKYSSGFTSSSGTGGSSGRGRADHLKPYQFQKKDNIAEGVEGGRSSWRDYGDRKNPVGETGSLEFGGEFWGLGMSGHMDEEAFTGRGANREALERAFADVREDPTEGLPLGKWVGGAAKSSAGGKSSASSAEAASPDEDLTPDLATWHPRYDELHINHGEDVADTFCWIDVSMSALSGKDELLADLQADMFELASPSGQLEIIKQMYNRLDRQGREALAQHGF